MSRRNEEHRIQAALFEWAKYASAKHPGLKLMFAIPNGGARDAGHRRAAHACLPDRYTPCPFAGLSAHAILSWFQ